MLELSSLRRDEERGRERGRVHFPGKFPDGRTTRFAVLDTYVRARAHSLISSARSLARHALAYSPVDPTEDLRVVWVGGAVGDPVGPVLGEAVLLRHRLQPGGAGRQLHHHVGLVRAHVVAPQRRQGLVHAAGACREGEEGGMTLSHACLLPKNCSFQVPSFLDISVDVEWMDVEGSRKSDISEENWPEGDPIRSPCRSRPAGLE